jgi:preprotein translocase subunit Sss1
MKYKPPGEVCSTEGCEMPRRPGQRTCQECHAAYMRVWRRSRKEAREELAHALKAAGIRVAA